jgi:hypothetical protein
MSSEYPSKQETQRRQGGSSVQARRSETEKGAERVPLSGLVANLAKRLGKDPEEFAAQIDPDTIRRTRYPALTETLPDGTTIFKHDPGIVTDGRKASIRR